MLRDQRAQGREAGTEVPKGSEGGVTLGRGGDAVAHSQARTVRSMEEAIGGRGSWVAKEPGTKLDRELRASSQAQGQTQQAEQGK